MTGTVQDAVSLLFVPGSRSDRFAKATASGADVVILDLEDAVPETTAGAKAEARRAVRSWLDAGHRALVRLNALGTAESEADVRAIVDGAPPGLAGVVLAKAEDDDAVARLAAALPRGVAVVPLVESARGILASARLAAVPGVTRLALGAQDLTVDLRADGGDESLLLARSTLVLASRAAGLPSPIDSPSLELRDEDAVRASAAHAHRLGFGGKFAIHPAQVAVIHDAFAPTGAQLAWAREIAAATDGLGSAAGSMVDAPVAERARWILEQAARRRPGA